MTKIAVILFNLGGPDSKESIKPFLYNFFMDRNIIPLPVIFRFVIAKLISIRRSKREAGKSYHELGDRSPLLQNTQAQAEALERALNGSAEGKSYKVFVCMRYWHPMAAEIVRQVQNWGADKLVLLPLYPQFSTTTTWSALENWRKFAKDAGLGFSDSGICCYPLNEGFLKASVQNILKAHARAWQDGYKNIRFLFSAHGLPEDVIKGGDPYQWQCEQTAKVIVAQLQETIPDVDWQICYQSRVGPKKWIGPSTENEIKRAAQEGKAVIIYPHAFTQEHVETLVELDIEYRHLAEEEGVKGYYRAETVGVHPDFIAGLAALVRERENVHGIAAEGEVRVCPRDFKRCCMGNASRVKSHA